MSVKNQLKWHVICQKNDIILTLWLTLFSLTKSFFFIRHNELLSNITEPYMKHLPTGLIGVFLFVSSIVFIIGVFVDHRHWRRIGLTILGGSWGALTFLAFTYHVGSGYPNSSWISYGFAALMTLVVAYKGVYVE